jgi:hypothetical protein
MFEFRSSLRLLGAVYDAVGDSDPTLPLFADEFGAYFPDARVVFVDRNRDACKASLIAMGLDEPRAEALLDKTQEGIERIAGQPRKTLRVPYDEIDERLPEVWDFCVGGGYDSIRAKCLMGMNVQTPLAVMQGDIHPLMASAIARRLEE